MATDTSKGRLWGTPAKVSKILERRGWPVLNAWVLFSLIRTVHRETRREIPPPRDFYRIIYALSNAGFISPDRDYLNHYRVASVADRPADEVVCLVDRFCCISHLSAMQRWGLTDRQPHSLMIARPDDASIKRMAAEIMKTEADENPWRYRPPAKVGGAFRLNNIAHPKHVRQRSVELHSSRQFGNSMEDRNSFARVTSVGQTFLDMLRRPALCGGMAHVLDVWEEHARSHMAEIVAVVDNAESIIKCRAGHIIEERLNISEPRVAAWRKFAQRGGSRRLDPGSPYIPDWSETWMISLNA